MLKASSAVDHPEGGAAVSAKPFIFISCPKNIYHHLPNHRKTQRACLRNHLSSSPQIFSTISPNQTKPRGGCLPNHLSPSPQFNPMGFPKFPKDMLTTTTISSKLSHGPVHTKPRWGLPNQCDPQHVSLSVPKNQRGSLSYT